MKFIFTLLLLFTPLAANEGLDQIVQKYEDKMHIGIEVISLKTGETLYAKNAHQNFVPASNIKLLTAGAALSHLGPDYQFETKFLTDPHGDLIIQGSGDPSFSLSDLEGIVRNLRLQQIEGFSGDIIVDNFAFDEFHQGPGWMWDDVNDFTYAQVNALTINHNVVDLWVKPSSMATAPKVFAYPKTEFIRVKNRALTDDKEAKLSVGRDLLKQENTIIVKGAINLTTPTKAYRVPIENPHLYTASLLQIALRRSGIAFSGNVLVRQAPQNAIHLTTHKSQPLQTLLTHMMKTSDNLYADNFFKKLGQLTSNEQGTWKNGSQAVRSFLEKEANLNTSSLVVLDGSGLSRYNLVSPHFLAKYLAWIYHDFTYGPEFLSSLVLRNPTLRVKTGTMTGLSALSGYLMTEDKEWLAFSIIINGNAEDSAKDIENEICSHFQEFLLHK